ncbi:hypothetical protein AB0B63_18580 [Micromonospora sp. NPDC049081]|uniref:hypothetical protein n=1 Tax=Micromonospora sp. NPDC049081 TaxID=3155150 RepID=UPI003400C3B9
MSVTMNADVAKALREPFPAELIGKLPRIWCKGCRDNQRSGRTCEQHTKVKCRDCNNNITQAHLHLDYVGHAETTDRFLSVDPEWNWEPMAFGTDGLPLIDRAGGLWIRLTIAGVTRPGYGHANGKEGPDAVKEAIGDALRNAGMRFGVALDLWGAKFKDDPSDSGTDSQQQPTADEWENARPVGRGQELTAEQRVEQGRRAIATATTKEALDNLAALVAKYETEGSMSADQAKTLKSAIVARESELRTQQPRRSAPVEATA